MDDEQDEILRLATWLKNIGDEANANNTQHQHDYDIVMPLLVYQAFFLSYIVSIIFLLSNY